jgi:galactokinase/mevalonate kinase-like predicted kinase
MPELGENRLSMEMTQTRRKQNGNKERKRVLRGMKKLVVVVRGHARRYRALLDENWQAKKSLRCETRSAFLPGVGDSI